MQEFMETLIAALLGSVFGGGLLVKIFWGALLNALKKDFATVDELNRLGSRVNGLETVAIEARSSADEAHAKLESHEELLTERWSHLTERITREVIAPLERIAASVDLNSKEIIRHGAAIEQLMRDRDRERNR